ncbi:hypothetical protein V1506DRAFT_549592 [Lipomyces tetrasporus]
MNRKLVFVLALAMAICSIAMASDFSEKMTDEELRSKTPRTGPGTNSTDYYIVQHTNGSYSVIPYFDRKLMKKEDEYIQHWKLSLLCAAASGTACAGMFKSIEIAGPLGYTTGAAAGAISIITFGMFLAAFYKGVKVFQSPPNLRIDKRVLYLNTGLEPAYGSIKTSACHYGSSGSLPTLYETSSWPNDAGSVLLNYIEVYWLGECSDITAEIYDSNEELAIQMSIGCSSDITDWTFYHC